MAKKSKKHPKHKLPASAEEAKELVHTKYEEKPVVIGKSKYEEEEEAEEEKTEM